MLVLKTEAIYGSCNLRIVMPSQVRARPGRCRGLGCTATGAADVARFLDRVAPLLRWPSLSQIAETIRIDRAGADAEHALPKVDINRSRLREERAIQDAEKALHKIGKDVSREAQDIFEALDKTMPCHWEGKDIIVVDEVRIREPYALDSCMALHNTPASQNALDRVKKVLELELAKLRQ